MISTLISTSGYIAPPDHLFEVYSWMCEFSLCLTVCIFLETGQIQNVYPDLTRFVKEPHSYKPIQSLNSQLLFELFDHTVNKIRTIGAEEVSDSQQSVSSSTKHADKSQRLLKTRTTKACFF